LFARLARSAGMSREVAILIDGGFLTKRLTRLVQNPDKLTPKKVVAIIRAMCKEHVQRLTDDHGSNWHRHVYRIFYYDAPPFEGQAHHPLTRRQINFGASDQAMFQRELFDLLRKQRNVALRLGHLSKLSGWTLQSDQLVRLLRSRALMQGLADLQPEADGSLSVPPALAANLAEQAKTWAALQDWMVRLDLRQKGVDMRIGLDIASITLKRLASTIILVAGDADFVPAAKLARREGLQFILDPLWQSVSDDLFEHIDGLKTALKKPEPARKAKEA
jgi:uncharacterized LabA/DUF88 family protein